MTFFEVELPGVALDNLVFEDAVDTLVLINRAPEPGEVGVPVDSEIFLEIADTSAAGAPDVAQTQVYVNGVLAFDGGVDGTGFSSSYEFPQVDVLRIAITSDAAFGSEELVSVRVVSAGSTGGTLDVTYTFTTADIVAPMLVSAEAQDLQRVRVTFNEDVQQLGAAVVGDALNPASWVLQRWGDGVVPLVSAKVTAVTAISGSTLDLTTNIPLTPGGTYHLLATVLDTAGNELVSGEVVFTGWSPPVPAGRDFDLYRQLPEMNRNEDETLDLKRWVGCLQEVLNLLLYDVDRYIDILDPDTAPEEFVDAMLADLGNPFSFELTETDKRRLANVLVDMYRLKGTEVGIEQVILFFVGIVAEVEAYNGNTETLVLGESEIGLNWILGPGTSFERFSFEVVVGVVLTDQQREQIRSIVEYMKPAHTHFIRLVEPEVPVILDHLELGLSELGENWFLH